MLLETTLSHGGFNSPGKLKKYNSKNKIIKKITRVVR